MFEKILYLLIFSIFVFAPFDILLNIKIFGFSFRLVNFLVGIFIILGGLVVIKEYLNQKKIYLPLWLILFIIVGILNSIFIVNSILIIRGILYSVWFWMFIVMLFIFVNLYNKISTETLIKLYIFSFVIHSVFGIIQQILFYNLEIELFMIQPGRANGFTYEPSYYLTYLSPSLVLAIFYSIFSKPEIKSSILYYLSVGLILSAILFSTSKIFIVIFLLTFAFILIFGVLIYLNNSLKKKLSEIIRGRVYIIIFSTITLVIVYLLISITPLLSQKEVSLIEKVEKINREKETTSFGPRIEVMKKTLKVAIDNIMFGTSLGGVAPHIAKNSGIIPKTNLDVKDYEGMSIYLEILAGVGIIGFILFALAFLKLIYDGVLVSFKLLNKEKTLEFGIIFGLISGLVIEMIVLSFNQNVLRFYFWNHIAILGLAVKSFSENKAIV